MYIYIYIYYVPSLSACILRCYLHLIYTLFIYTFWKEKKNTYTLSERLYVKVLSVYYKCTNICVCHGTHVPSWSSLILRCYLYIFVILHIFLGVYMYMWIYMFINIHHGDACPLSERLEFAVLLHIWVTIYRSLGMYMYIYISIYIYVYISWFLRSSLGVHWF